MWTGISIFTGRALVKRWTEELASVADSDETNEPGKRFQWRSQLVREVRLLILHPAIPMRFHAYGDGPYQLKLSAKDGPLFRSCSLGLIETKVRDGFG